MDITKLDNSEDAVYLFKLVGAEPPEIKEFAKSLKKFKFHYIVSDENLKLIDMKKIFDRLGVKELKKIIGVR